MIQSPSSPNRIPTFESVLSKISGFSRETINDETTLDYDLGIGSLDRIELLDALEKVKGSSIDEEAFSQKKTVKELRDLVKQDLISEEENRRELDTEDEMGYFPQWSTRFPLRFLRRLFQASIMLPLFRHYMDLTVSGIELVHSVPPPFLLAANHASHLDVVAILAALPPSIRVRVAPAVRQEYFQAHFFPLGVSFFTRINSSFKYYLTCLLFNAFPLPQRSSGVRRTLRYTGLIVSRGFCPLIFPEGLRTPDGSLKAFRPGIGLMARSLELPVIPVHLSGLFEIFPVHAQWPKRGPIHVRVGEPIFPGRMEEASDFTLRLEDEISRLSRK
jgi:1-acyl-sn-glycerol-3-phosphate acyltransferase/acyl carrier protein